MLNAENGFEIIEEIDVTRESGLKLSFESRFNDAEYQRWLDTLAPSKAKRELDGQTFLAR
jgi:hypothetical protein